MDNQLAKQFGLVNVCEFTQTNPNNRNCSTIVPTIFWSTDNYCEKHQHCRPCKIIINIYKLSSEVVYLKTQPW